MPRQQCRRILRLSSLIIRRPTSSSLNPVVAQRILYRTIELTEAGLRLPNWLRRAVSFEERNRLPQALSATCRPVLAALNALGCVGLREVLRWTESGFAPVLDAMREITGSSREMLGFDINRLDRLEPLHRKLCRLSLGNRLGWIELAYFVQSEGLSFGEVRKLAEDLSGYGVLIPDLASPPKDIHLTESEVEYLSHSFKNVYDEATHWRVDVFEPREHILDGIMKRFNEHYFSENEDYSYYAPLAPDLSGISENISL